MLPAPAGHQTPQTTARLTRPARGTRPRTTMIEWAGL
jgi:hypothetical protein